MFITNNPTLVKHQKSENIMTMIGCKNFLFLFMILLTAAIVKNSHMLAEIHFIFLKQCPGLNLKVIQYQIWTSRKIWEK